MYTRLRPYSMTSFDEEICQLLLSVKNLPVPERFRVISEAGLKKPYWGGACGEGEGAQFDQSPLYRTDCFDCLTYVNWVLALLNSHCLGGFQKNIVQLNYYEGHPSYLHRFHFMSADWNLQNAHQGWIDDVTTQIIDQQGRSLADQAKTLIERSRWIRFRSLTDIKLLEDLPMPMVSARLEWLHAQANHLPDVSVTTPYVPLCAFFTAEKTPNPFIFQQLKTGMILEVVRPNWDLREQIGTRLNVSHLGWVVWQGGQVFLRHASSALAGVADTSLVDYLKSCLRSPTIVGVNIQQPQVLRGELS